jgi:hypothetical protein
MQKKQPNAVQITGSDGPFTYRYIAFSAVPGIALPDGLSETPLCAFPDSGARAFLARDLSSFAEHWDRTAAIGYMMLSGLIGSPRYRWPYALWSRVKTALVGADAIFLENLAREAARIREQRTKDFLGPGCFLVFEADAPVLTAPNFNNARRIKTIGFGIDVIDSTAYRAKHAKEVHSAATALSLGLTELGGNSDTAFLGDLLYLKGANELSLYCKTITAGAVGVVTTNQVPSAAVESAAGYVPALLSDDKLEVVVRLFVNSQRKSNDNLRAFIAGWSGLELLINRFEKVHRKAWLEILSNKQITLPDWDKDLTNVARDEYRLRDVFYAVSCVLDRQSTLTDCALFADMNNKRSGFYHRLEVNEQDLPTAQVLALFRKYLKLGLAGRGTPELDPG